MKREIKFRAYLEFDDGFGLMISEVTVYPDSIGFSDDYISNVLPKKYTIYEDGIYHSDDDHFDKVLDLLPGEDWYWVEDVEPMQYTGLKDKNGKEIYEGDIVRFEHDFTDYDYDDIGFAFRDVRTINEEVKYSNASFNIDAYTKYEIIGNIHENPELI